MTLKTKKRYEICGRKTQRQKNNKYLPTDNVTHDVSLLEFSLVFEHYIFIYFSLKLLRLTYSDKLFAFMLVLLLVTSMSNLMSVLSLVIEFWFSTN